MGKPSALSEEMSADLLDIDKRILQILSNQPSRSAKGIANECEISVRTVERYLKALQLKGKLQRVGATKGEMWRVI
ncbi:winged helix-turn-helix domain-containing protein [Citrobacter sp. Cpo142]|nr:MULTISPECIES: winged helix-turn-helix domain-containing protein [Citrobacter]MCR3699889.1 winged helix-turn-helix domain-containing protein [Citrobacter portucalensis]MCX8973665.1 winged helix-turn-helix domain-containing protein [Citrobacter portucalensis]MCX9031868.1 winged helix-turn-helix domain-containing protein [Citrobacter portucalensis]MDM2778314.1 winged helix-turn-helix domain-containing protein [Citrobacter sp. Cpo142]MDM2801742.1 winged helix-turn-helix domain-containing protei